MKTTNKRILSILLIVVSFLFMIIFVSGCGPSELIAVKVDDNNITEKEVTDEVAVYRKQNNLENAQDWENWLKDNNKTVADFRDSIIEKLIKNKIIELAAAEKGVFVSKEELDMKYIEKKEEAGSTTDEEFENLILTDYGQTKEQYLKTLKQEMLEKALLEKIKSEYTLTDDQVLANANTYVSIIDNARDISSIVVADKGIASDIKNKALKGEDFVSLAKEYSISNLYDGCDSFVGLDTSTRDAVRNANKGDIILVPTDYTNFVIKINDIYKVAPSGYTTIDEVPTKIREYITQNIVKSETDNLYTTYLTGKKNKCTITTNSAPPNLPYDIKRPD